ncbi:CDGSH iron-sulfur domain-containing protein [Paenibacillus methanolicus]|uniref:Iron-binding CDGSH zinc finger protein n=1 Tax=Paenibacillus methanolicus TaxID=582686 RepID=A0A5S5C470_9BACL|nr:CDGSH iron-sulfur domain-containing protein [Paenibacillus methanolicus]TYP73408.1 iron-binding CDGSH zinc finger protein [Paenibacillus methanolicus]
MSEVIIKVIDNGPLRIMGQVEMVDAEGNRFETTESFILCRCGLSDKKPFCDMTHRGKFESAPRA